MAICEATTFDIVSSPERTTAAAVSSHELSIPRMKVEVMCCFHDKRDTHTGAGVLSEAEGNPHPPCPIVRSKDERNSHQDKRAYVSILRVKGKKKPCGRGSRALSDLSRSIAP